LTFNNSGEDDDDDDDDDDGSEDGSDGGEDGSGSEQSTGSADDVVKAFASAVGTLFLSFSPNLKET